MEASNLQIYWHESQPVYSLCFQPTTKTINKDNNDDNVHDIPRELFTAGGDNRIRMWRLNMTSNGTKVETIDYLSSLQQHEQAVNVVRFNNGPCDNLASAGDDGVVLLWRRYEKDQVINNSKFREPMGINDNEETSVSWYIWKRLRSNSGSEIYDLAWSPDNRYIAVACMDNCVRVFDVESGRCIVCESAHSHYVQGIAWDPLNEYILSQSADRSVVIYKLSFTTADPVVSGGDETAGAQKLIGLQFFARILKGSLPERDESTGQILSYDSSRTSYLFHNETLTSFFRRLAISPCGSLFCIPAGIFRVGDPNAAPINAVYIYTRGTLSQLNQNGGSGGGSGVRPPIVLPFFKKPAVAIAFNPVFYKLDKPVNEVQQQPFIDLPYKLYFAVATLNEIIIYGTNHVEPVAIVNNLHYTPLTDLSWSSDGKMLMVSSTDGFCSYVSIDQKLLGEALDKETWSKYIGAISTDGVKQDEKNEKEKKVATESSEEKKKFDIVNILPVKRRFCGNKESVSVTQPSTKGKGEGEAKSETNTSSSSDTSTTVKSKRRIQPVLIE